MNKIQITSPTPTIELKVYLAEIGYQAEIFLDGKRYVIECRDFSANRTVDSLQQDFYLMLINMIEMFRQEH